MPHFGILLFAALTVSPTSASMPPRASRTFSASGGTAPYTFSFVSNASGATLAGSSYTAGAKGDAQDVVRVKDAMGESSTISISVGPGASITPATQKLPPHGSFVFAAKGGSGTGFTWSLDGSGTVDNGGHYIATASGGATIHATDSLGNTASATVTLGPNVGIDPVDASLLPGESLTFAATGGSGDYTFALDPSASGGTIDSDSGVYVAGPQGSVDDVVTVKDGLGNTTTATVHVRENPVGPTPTPTPSARSDQIDDPTSEQAGNTKTHVNLAGGGAADNACDCEVVGAPTIPANRGSSAPVLAFAVAVGLTLIARRRRID